MKLTKKWKEDMYRRDNGVGVLFVKTGNNEITEIEFVLGRNGKFGTLNGTLLTEMLNELSMSIEEMSKEKVELEKAKKAIWAVWVTAWEMLNGKKGTFEATIEIKREAIRQIDMLEDGAVK